jgi:hypothetical protein
MNFMIHFSFFVEKAFGYLVGIAMNLCIKFGNLAILFIFIIPVHEQRMSFFSSVLYTLHCEGV